MSYCIIKDHSTFYLLINCISNKSCSQYLNTKFRIMAMHIFFYGNCIHFYCYKHIFIFQIHNKIYQMILYLNIPFIIKLIFFNLSIVWNNDWQDCFTYAVHVYQSTIFFSSLNGKLRNTFHFLSLKGHGHSFVNFFCVIV